MADDVEEVEDDEEITDDEDEEGLKKKKLTGKKIILFGVAPVVVIALGVTAAFIFGLLGSDDAELAEGEGHAQEEDIADVVFYDLPEILVTLNSGDRSTSYLKIKIALELEDDHAVNRLESLLPRIIDNFQVYLRELRLEDLNGSAGLFRLKEELLMRVNASVHPLRINDVLFKEMLVQ